MAQIDCQRFSGYKPCGLNDHCNSSCPHYKPAGPQILLIHLGALGAVLRSTALLASIRKKHPGCSITWVTERPADQLLKNLPQVDRVLTLDTAHLVALTSLSFDVAYCVDKSLSATGLERFVRAKLWLGFRSNAIGKILPASESARELWEIGLDDHRKFRINQKPETQLISEALELEYRRDGYEIGLTPVEKEEASRRRQLYSPKGLPLVGINTGCSGVIPYKKLTVEGHRQLIRKLKAKLQVEIALLGGPEDERRNVEIAEGLDVVLTPTKLGLRDGLISVNTCDVVFSGDSLGLHMAIGLKKPVVVWFGPTCPQEIDLFELGTKLLAEVPCSPCWKRSCSRTPMCYDRVNLDEAVESIDKWLCLQKGHASSSSKPPSLETSSSASL